MSHASPQPHPAPLPHESRLPHGTGIGTGIGTGVVPGTLDVEWHPDIPLQVHRFTEDTLILRQNKSVHYEAPFLYLLFGEDSALLIDTGATADPDLFPLRETVDELITAWLAGRPARDEPYGLIVAHTHHHDDHIAADGQFTGRPHTTVVGHGVQDVIAAYTLPDWPNGLGELDLGGRVVDLIPGPGHEEAAVVFYDRRTGLLLTGDSLYPGRLYVRDAEAFAATVDRLLDFCATHTVSYVLGCHIEMTTTPDVDYPRGTVHQPDEAPLPLGTRHLHTLHTAVSESGGRPGRYPCGEFILVHLGPDGLLGP